MSFFSQLEKLQRSSEKTRQIALIIVVSFIMISIILIWANTIDLSIGEKEEKNIYNKNNPPSPFSIFKETALSLSSSVKSIFKYLELRN